MAALVPSAGSITLQIELRSDAGAVGARIPYVSARCAARVPLIACARPSHFKVKVMELPSMLQGESVTRLLQGAAAGAVATMFVGFY